MTDQQHQSILGRLQALGNSINSKLETADRKVVALDAKADSVLAFLQKGKRTLLWLALIVLADFALGVWVGLQL